MRTTLDISDDILLAAKELARRLGSSAGQVISDLARQGLARQATHEREPGENTQLAAELGFDPLPHRGGVVTNALIDDLRERDGT